MKSIEHLKANTFFRGFKDEHLKKIAKLCREEIYQPQDVIVKEGGEAKNLYILIEGVVTIQIQIKKYQDAIVSTIENKGELFGWSAMVEPRRYTAAVKCLEKTKVLSISGGELEKLFEGDSVMGLAFMKKIAGLIDNRLITMRKRLISSIS